MQFVYGFDNNALCVCAVCDTIIVPEYTKAVCLYSPSIILRYLNNFTIVDHKIETTLSQLLYLNRSANSNNTIYFGYH